MGVPEVIKGYERITWKYHQFGELKEELWLGPVVANIMAINGSEALEACLCFHPLLRDPLLSEVWDALREEVTLGTRSLSFIK